MTKWYDIDVPTFKIEVEKIRMPNKWSISDLCMHMGYKTSKPYYHAIKTWSIQTKLVKRLHILGADVSKFMRRDDFVNEFWNE